MNNSERIQLWKEAIDLAVGGLMNGAQLTEFITTLKDKSGFMKKMRIDSGIVKSLDLDRLGIDTEILREKLEDTAIEDLAGVHRGVETLTPVKAMAMVKLTYDWLQKAIGGNVEITPEMKQALEAKVFDLFSKQWANDSLALAFKGDKQSQSKFYKIIDGINKKAHLHAATHKFPFDANMKYSSIFKGMLDKLPSEFQSDPAALSFIVSPKTRRAYKDELAERNTALGDLMSVKNAPVFCEDILVEPLWVMPEGVILLTLPENLAIGYGQQMLVERDKDIFKQNISIVSSMDIDANFVIPDAIVIGELEQ